MIGSLLVYLAAALVLIGVVTFALRRYGGLMSVITGVFLLAVGLPIRLFTNESGWPGGIAIVGALFLALLWSGYMVGVVQRTHNRNRSR